MNALKQTLLTFWQARDTRERQMLIACALVLLVAFAYGVLWQPLANAQDKLKRQLPQQQRNLIELQQGIALLKTQGGGSQNNDGDLRSTVQAQLDRYGIKADLQALPQEKLKLAAGQLDGAKALQLITALERGAGLRLEETRLAGVAGQLQLSMIVGR
ncbi:hypothetical protein IGB42_01290 [Andreprevotia sp. IGB-42]|uniref:type II secretion system protein GspM n=1 Tax=Andreprevotia sp. IGB-42 TaxID=2497473 RepID=UPI001357F27A|nr:type II secretion system protein GspM [Andreprevotia sp. IGB-42]KAF0814389.1 hypothetical protein IGB42_01290 [Andreprevotia sp. IGB-42]